MSGGNELSEFTPERWAAAREVLQGGHDDRVSLSAAARAAGVSLRTLKTWIRRSRERRPTDDPLIHTLAEEADSAVEEQAGRLEDVAWERGVVGHEKGVYKGGELVGTERVPDNKLLMRMLEHRDPSYRPQNTTTLEIKPTDTGELYRRFLAAKRIAVAEAAAIEGEFHEVKPEAVTESLEDAVPSLR